MSVCYVGCGGVKRREGEGEGEEREERRERREKNEGREMGQR